MRRLLIQELVQGTFDEASDDHLRSKQRRATANRRRNPDDAPDKKTAMLERVVA